MVAFDQSVIELFDITNAKLNLAFQQVDLDQSVGLQYLEGDNLKILYKDLQQVKYIVDDLYSRLVNNNPGNLALIKIDFKIIELIAKRLNSLQKDKHLQNNEANSFKEIIENLISEYIMIICYYTLVMKCILQLPKTYDAALYYKSILDSFPNKLMYLLQTSIEKFLNGIKRFYIENRRKWNRQNILDLPRSLFQENFQPRITRLFFVKTFQVIGLPKIYHENPFKLMKVILYQLPKLLLNEELQTKHNEIDRQNKLYTIKLGKLMTNFPIEKLESLKTFFDNGTALTDLITLTEGFSVDDKNINKLATLKKPSLVQRYWPICFLTIFAGPRITRKIWDTRFSIEKFVKENLIDFVSGLIKNWIWIPLKKVWSTVKHDEGSEIAVMSKGTLKTEKDSLSRMVVSFLIDNSDDIENIEPELLANQIEHGDLNEFMEIYEKQLHRPIKNIISGKLIRSLLIQIQKTKVDGSLALDGIDRMLQSQQLVFGIVALSPSLIISYTLITMILRLIKLGTIWTDKSKTKEKISHSLNRLERILNYSDLEENTNDKYLNKGLLAMEISNIYSLGSMVIPKSRYSQWVFDINELMNNKFSNEAKLNIITRIYHTYGKYI